MTTANVAFIVMLAMGYLAGHVAANWFKERHYSIALLLVMTCMCLAMILAKEYQP